MMRKYFKRTIIDNNGVEEPITCMSETAFRKECETILNDYYECCSNYGNPIADMIKYINTKDLEKLILNYNYTIEIEDITFNAKIIFNTRAEAFAYMLSKNWNDYERFKTVEVNGKTQYEVLYHKKEDWED